MIKKTERNRRVCCTEMRFSVKHRNKGRTSNINVESIFLAYNLFFLTALLVPREKFNLEKVNHLTVAIEKYQESDDEKKKNIADSSNIGGGRRQEVSR